MALDGWSWVRWGMNAEEIVSASGGLVRKVEDEERDDKSGPGFSALAIGEVAMDAFVFDVSFRAAPGGSTLTSFRLELHDPEQYGALQATLGEAYGAGEVIAPEADGSIEGVRWRTPDGDVELKRLTWPMDLGVDVVVDYRGV